MFVDEKVLSIGAGKGGDGAALFRREKYVPFGGPDGGDGGRGGDVLIQGRNNLHALAHLARSERIDAKPGDNGGHQRSTGADGADAPIQVPLGTEVYVQNEDVWEKIIEITEEGQEYLIAKGGNGGWGNWHFKSSINQTPDRANNGQPGEKKVIKLVLKLIADVGLVGFPNAGKSTLLSVISAARPKIANYPFTTLEPQLGVAVVGKKGQEQCIVVADLPGLIEGASEGKGLGAKFLKHVERTKLVLHCIDCSAEPADLLTQYDQIRRELEQWSPVLAQKEEKIVLTKTDLLLPEDVELRRKAVEKHTHKKVMVISAATHKGISELLTDLL